MDSVSGSGSQAPSRTQSQAPSGTQSQEPSGSQGPTASGSGAGANSVGASGGARPSQDGRSNDEAEVEHILFDNDSGADGLPQEDEDTEGEDLLQDNYLNDYRAIPHLDTYEAEALDDQVEDDRDSEQRAEDRLAAEAAMARRDATRGVLGQRRALPSFLEDGDDEEEAGPAMRARRRRQRLEREAAEAGGERAGSQGGVDGMEEDEYGEEDGEDDEGEMYNVQGNLREWVSRDEVRRFIARRFRNFLNTFRSPKDEASIEYVNRIRDLVEMNSCSLELDYNQLLHTQTLLAVWLADAPKQVLEVLDEVARSAVFRLYPNYEQVHDEIFVRVTNLPVLDAIRDIRSAHLHCLIRVSGVVTRRTGVFPQLQQVKYDCAKCQAVLGPFFQNSAHEVQIRRCPECQSPGPFSVNIEQTIYRNYQKLTLQESPGTVPAGRLPRHKEVILLHNLIDCARPGEEIEVTGIYTNNFDAALNTRQGFPVFSTVLEANHVLKRQDSFMANKLTDEDRDEILKLSKDPRIAQRIMKSIAPSIFGHEDIKRALALAMFGGQEKNVNGKHRLRGDINVLMLGDPGTAKSQFLKYVEKTAVRAVYTTGKGASAVGLTAAVHKDPITREWTLEGGALVLADRGTCLIDEFDKMNEQDRVSIHEAMEQQSISISKAGIVTTLAARCSVIAAANPIGGRYDGSKTFGQNVELTEPILSRFDVLLVVKDVVDPVVDETLAKFVIGSHIKSHPRQGLGEDLPRSAEPGDDIGLAAAEADPDIIPQPLLRKYLTYAKQTVFPRLQDADTDKIARVYADLRRQSMNGQGVPIAVRHVESMIRMSEAHARMHLRPYVNDDDVDTAISVLLQSFVATQKYGVQRSLQKSFTKFLTHKRDFNELLLSILRQLLRDALRFHSASGRTGEAVEIKLDDLEARAREYNIGDVQPFLESRHFLSNSFILDQDSRVITHPIF